MPLAQMHNRCPGILPHPGDSFLALFPPHIFGTSKKMGVNTSNNTSRWAGTSCIKKIPRVLFGRGCTPVHSSASSRKYSDTGYICPPTWMGRRGAGQQSGAGPPLPLPHPTGAGEASSNWGEGARLVLVEISQKWTRSILPGCSALGHLAQVPRRLWPCAPLRGSNVGGTPRGWWPPLKFS